MEDKKLLAPKDGTVTATAKPTVTEREIADDRDLIIQRLHTMYLSLNDAMHPFQQEWEAGPMAALGSAVWGGAAEGASEWGEDFADLFKAETWTTLGDQIGSAAGNAYDSLAENAAELSRDFIAATNKANAEAQRFIDAPLDTLQNWTWQGTEAVEKSFNEQRARLNEIQRATLEAINKASTMSLKIYQHREAILNLSNLIERGDPKPIQNFVDTVVMDIDPELAKAIKNDPNFYVVLEVIADHESVLSYLAYASLMFEAVPPNFYAHVASKGAVYLLIEVVLLVISALLSAGTAAAARIASLAARIAMSSAKIAGATKKAQQLIKAVKAFTDALEDFSRAADDLHRLGAKLHVARQRGVTLKGPTRSTVTVRRQSATRDKKCRFCGSTKHATPHGRLGTVQYE